MKIKLFQRSPDLRGPPGVPGPIGISGQRGLPGEQGRTVRYYYLIWKLLNNIYIYGI